MFTLLTRRPPFSGGSIPEVLHRLRYEAAPPVRRYSPSVPIELEEIIDQLLQKDASERIPTALVLANQLQAMEHGLSAKTVAEHPTIMTSPPMVSPNDQKTRESSPERPPATELSPTSVEPPSGDLLPEAYSWNDATVVTSGPESEQDFGPPANCETVAEPKSSRNRFTTLDEQRRQQEHSAAQPVDLLKIGGLVLGLVALVGFVVWCLSPPTADELYTQIATIAKEGNLHDAKPKIEKFLASHANDARCAEVEDWLLDLQCQFLFSRLRTRSERETLSDVQQAYLEAMMLAEAKPQEAVEQLEMLVSNYRDASDEADPITCVLAAKHQLKRLKTAE